MSTEKGDQFYSSDSGKTSESEKRNSGTGRSGQSWESTGGKMASDAREDGRQSKDKKVSVDQEWQSLNKRTGAAD